MRSEGKAGKKRETIIQPEDGNIFINGEDNIRKALVGEPVGTLVYSEDDN